MARGNSSFYYASHIPLKGVRNPHILEFRGTNMNENSKPFSFINYAAHCTAWLSYGKR